MRISLFLIAYLLIYGGMHYYLYRKVRRALALRGFGRGIVALSLLGLVLLPMAHHSLEAMDQPLAAQTTAVVAFYWMGFAFLLFCISLVFDLLNRLSRKYGGLAEAKTLLLMSMTAALATTLYGLYEARHIQVENVTIESGKIPAGSTPLRLVQISDLHLGPMYRPERLTQLVEKIQALKPDLIVATGDIVDGQAEHINGYTRPLNELHAPLGKFAVTGNHEFYVGLEQSQQVLEQVGFTVLRNESATPLPWLELVGVDDPSGARMGVKPAVSEAELLNATGPGHLVILLKHPPRISDEALQHADLQLSGHVHGGQIAPFGLLTWLAYRQPTGLSRISERLQLYTSRGTGTWGPPIRVLAPPEITLFELQPGIH